MAYVSFGMVYIFVSSTASVALGYHGMDSWNEKRGIVLEYKRSRCGSTARSLRM